MKPKTKQNKHAPPEAYAAFIRLYMEWMEKEKEDQLALVVDSVKTLTKQDSTRYENYIRDEKEERKRVKLVFPESLDKELLEFLECCSDEDLKSMPGHFPKAEKKAAKSSSDTLGLATNSSLFTPELDEYVNNAYVSFLNHCSAPDSFAQYLQECFDKSNMQKEFNKIKTQFKNRVISEWEDAFNHLNAEEFNAYITEDFKKREAEFEKIKEDFLNSYTGYPTLEDLFLKYAQSMREHIKYQRKRDRKNVCLDDTSKSEEPYSINSNPEETLLMHGFFDNMTEGLNNEEKRILRLYLDGYKQEEIAAEIKKSTSTVSRKIQKIKSFLSKK